MKQETQFSLFQALQTKVPPTLVTLREVNLLVTTNVTLKENTEKFRYFMSQGFKKDADSIKVKGCLAFTPAAVFGQYRRYNCITAITQYSMVDLDDLTEAETVRFMELLKDDPYWLLAYITISGKGLRIIFRVEGVTDVLGVINLEMKTLLSPTKVGILMNKLGFKKVRSNKSRGYKVHRYSVDEISRNRKGTQEEHKNQELPF